jgi:hypothetical protein
MPPKRRSVRTLARVGLLARGAVYFLVGMLALMVAIHEPGGRTTDSQGAMRELLRKPMGVVLLSAIAFGLFCYALWRLLDGIHDYDGYGKGWRGFFARSGQIFGALVHLSLGAYALNLIFLFTRTTTKVSEQKLVRWLFSLPLGDWIVGGVGGGIVIFGISQFVVAWREDYRHYMMIPQGKARFLMPICRYGLMARGLVFMLIGSFFVQAAIKHSPREAGGFREAWRALRQQPHGEIWVGVVAVGFMAYALFSATEAAYRKS